MNIYTTIQGDTWDIIAKKIYNDEMKADYLMANNLDLIEVVIFPANIKIYVPDLTQEQDNDLPSWRN